MTASRQQCAEATVFLTLYKEALETLKQSAANNVDWNHYLGFRDRFIAIREKYSQQKLKNLLASNDYLLKLNDIDAPTWKNIEYMRFNYYVFLKHLPAYQTFTGGPKQLIAILKQGTQSLRNELEKAKPIE